MPSASSVEPAMSQKTTVTVFRTSRVDEPPSAGSGLAQAPQNLKPSGFCWPQAGHAITILSV
jgi:hypothetical protein